MTSIVYSCLELARRLAADGHHVVFAGRSDARALAQRQGLEFLELTPSGYGDFLRADAELVFLTRLLQIGRRRADALASLGLEDFARELRQLAPDVVLIDGEMHEHVLVCVGSGVRTGLLNSFCSIWRRPGLPPPHTLIRPGVGWRGSATGMALHWLALRLRKWLRSLTHRVRRAGCDRVSLLHALADRHGVDLHTEVDARQWLIPWTYRGLPALSLHALEFDFPHDPPELVRYVGPMTLHSRNDDPSPDESPDESARLDALLRARDRPLVYASFGSAFTAAPGLVRRLVDAARDQPWGLVVSLGGAEHAAERSEFGPIPGNVHLFDWLPQLRVLERADVAIVHGGINTIDECVLHGVPMLVYCGFETDMAGNTARVVHHGLGIAGDPRRDGPAEIRRHVETLLEDASFRDAVQQFRASYESYEKARVAERTVEELLR